MDTLDYTTITPLGSVTAKPKIAFERNFMKTLPGELRSHFHLALKYRI